MAIKKDSARQPTQLATLIINFGDPTAYGTAEGAIELPLGAVVIGGDIVVVTPFNGTTNTLSLGDPTLGTRYATTVDLKTAARTALTVTGFFNTLLMWLVRRSPLCLVTPITGMMMRPRGDKVLSSGT